MDGPRYSIDSSSSYGDSSEDTLSLPSPPVAPQSAGPPPFPLVINSLQVHPTEGPDGGVTVGVLNGQLTNITVNQYLHGLDPESVKDLVPDAVKLSCSSNTQLFSKDGSNRTELQSKKEDLEGLQKRWCYLIAALVALSVVTLLSTSVFSFANLKNVASSSTERQHTSTAPNIPPTPVDDSSSQLENLPGGPRVISRAMWLAQPPTGPLDNNTLPIKQVVVCHTAADPCFSNPDCDIKVRYVQQFHIEGRKWGDIGYNFLIGGDGCVYMGRGFEKVGAHTKGHNKGTLGVAFIGTFVKQMPNDVQIEAFHKLIEAGVNLGKIAADYSLVAQCQLQVTAAPGIALLNNMTSWPHYDSTLPVMCTSF